jgi:TPR repeat protein
MRFPIIILLSVIVVACCSPSLPSLKSAAEQGDVDAQVQLAERYFVGDRVAFDQTKAAYWFKKAGEQGHQYGFYRLGQIYEFGQGVTPDIHLAARYYEKAARLNGAGAQEALARLHVSCGLGEKDFLTGYMWQLLAMRHNGLMFQASNFGAEKHLTVVERQEAERAAQDIAEEFR